MADMVWLWIGQYIAMVNLSRSVYDQHMVESNMCSDGDCSLFGNAVVEFNTLLAATQ
jgi:hypothetical protein